MEFLHCPVCGAKTKTTQLGDDLVKKCTSCNKIFHDFSYVCVIMCLINKDNKVCVIKQSYGENKYVLVAGFVKPKERLEEAIKREVNEETNLDCSNIKYLGSFISDNENLMVGFSANVDGLISLSSEVSEIRFESIEDALNLLKEAKTATKVLLKLKETLES